MFPCGPEALAPTVHAPENLPGIIRALSHKANSAYAKKLVAASALKHVRQSGTGDHITTTITKLQNDVASYHAKAQQLHAAALDVEKQHKASLNAFARMKPGLIKGVFATAVAAEIISIPVLLMSCVMMTKPHPATEKKSA